MCIVLSTVTSLAVVLFAVLSMFLRNFIAKVCVARPDHERP